MKPTQQNVPVPYPVSFIFTQSTENINSEQLDQSIVPLYCKIPTYSCQNMWKSRIRFVTRVHITRRNTHTKRE